MPGGLDILPVLHVRGVELQKDGALLVRGFLEGWTGPEEGLWFWLWTTDDNAITPEVKKYEPNGEVVVRISSEDSQPEISVDSELPWLRAYWQANHVKMIRRGEWKRRKFVASDAQHFELDGAHGWGRLQDGFPDGATPTHMEPAGWDHEHCEICRARIGDRGVEHGYVDPEDHWLCPSCYKRWAKPRDLGFLVGQE